MTERERRISATSLSVSILVGLLTVSTVAAGEEPLAVPASEAAATDAARQLDDGPRSGPALFDTDAAGAAALDIVAGFEEADWDREVLVGSLGQEPEAAFGFVRDRVGLDPYVGVLRGADGTLAVRAGSVWDRALLLRSLLTEQGHITRFASATLSADAAARVTARAFDPPANPIEAPPARSVLGLDMDDIVDRAHRDHALLTQALSGLEGGPATAALEAGGTGRDHVWVQVADDAGTWVDLDPTLADARMGESLVPATSFLEEAPDELRHALEVRLVTEVLADGLLTESIVLETRIDAAQRSSDEIWLTFHPQGADAGRILAEVMGDLTWLPVLSIGEMDIAGDAFELGGGGDVADFFGGGGADLTRLTLELGSVAPGRPPLTAQRVLLDRISPSVRASGTIIAELLDPLPAGTAPDALAGLHQLLISNGGADLRRHAAGRAVALGYGSDLLHEDGATDGLPLRDLLYPLAVANRSLVVASEGPIIGGIDGGTEARVFVDRPRAFLVSLLPYDALPDGTGLLTDLALDDIGVAIPAGGDPATERSIRRWYGVLQTALESEVSLVRSRAVDPSTAVVSSVSIATDAPLSLVTPADIGSVDPDAGALRRALEAGNVALVVGEPTRPAPFWSIDPATGRTRSIVEPGTRNGWVGGNNYVNSSAGGPRWVIDPKTGNTLGTIENGRFTPSNRPPPSRCQGGTEYVILLGCVSLPASITAGMASNIVTTAVVSWSIALIETIALS